MIIKVHFHVAAADLWESNFNLTNHASEVVINCRSKVLEGEVRYFDMKSWKYLVVWLLLVGIHEDINFNLVQKFDRSFMSKCTEFILSFPFLIEDVNILNFKFN